MTIRIGIIGTGGIAHVHADAYQKQNGRVEFVACCDLDIKKAEKFAEKFGFQKVYDNCCDMLKENNLDAVSVCTWNAAHAECTIAALNAGCHVFCEKPMAMNAQEAIQMKEAAETNGKVLMVGFVRRHGNDAKTALNLIKEGYVGDIYYAKASYLRRCGFPGGWFGDKSRSGGGPLIDLGVHVIDLARYIMGNPKPVSAYGATFNKLGARMEITLGPDAWKSMTEEEKPIFDVEDLATAMIRFDNGAVLQVETSFNLNIKESITTVDFFGDKAGLSFTPYELHTVVDNKLADIAIRGDFSFGDSFTVQVRNYLDAIERKADLVATAEDGVMLMKILDAIYLSAETGKSVDIT